eukprot:2672835-Prymnesium_polylepis.2
MATVLMLDFTRSQVMRECLESISCAGSFGVSIPRVLSALAFLGLFPSIHVPLRSHAHPCVASLPAAPCVHPPFLLCYTPAPRDTASRCARNTERAGRRGG